MEGQQVRGRYPLTALWLLADMRGDVVTKIRVMDMIAKIMLGRLKHRETAIRTVEEWLERYANGVRD